MTTPIQDSISFALAAEETVTNNTVRLSAAISCIITADMTEAKLKDGIREMMKTFISETQSFSDPKVMQPVTWQFSDMTRTSHPSGAEQVNITATARVHESDNYALDKRSREVSREGVMNITHIDVDTTPPVRMIEEAERNLRLKLLKKAQEELVAVNGVMTHDGKPGQYRLGNISFATAQNYSMSNTSNNMRGTAKMAMAASYGSGFGGGDDDALGNAVKLTMQATISLLKIVT